MVQLSFKAVVATIVAAVALVDAADVMNAAGHQHRLVRRCGGKKNSTITHHHPASQGGNNGHHHGGNNGHHNGGNNGHHNGQQQGSIITAYITDWAIPSSIAWNKLDHINYAFAVPGKDGTLSQFTASQLQSVVKEAHANQKTVSLSVGGWTGSLHFSDLVLTPSSRASFAKNIVQAVNDYNLDGIDIDWEYPNSANGVACNSNNKADTANFLAFMQLLRQQLGPNKILSTAVGVQPFDDESQNPSTSLAAGWAQTVDYFNMMVYDLAGSWNPVSGANSPLAADKDDSMSVTSAVQAWSSAGIPKSKLVVGVPFYGYLAKVNQPITAATGEHVKFDTSVPQIQGDQYDTKSADPCPGATATFSGEFQYRSIVQQGVNTNSSSWTNYWDAHTSTPYAYNSKDQTFLTYDNPASLTAKAKYVAQQKLGGIMLWSLEMDDANSSLLNAIQGARH
ncbi:hypothetical protein DM01DRAFT_1334193 [Hesseltinella vesiculosa]|uniref:GH18 domain-containing protein n=1 Tax=Hesseltinella vesiculosa TaxID=101127 RepID=A0A1X2GN55_9FUNG|nr:hypothetical protein DM01DRAFT_1334193 [Hesseltinella vesiculosa]